MAENIEESLQEDHGEYNSDISVDFTSQYVSLNLNGAFLFDSGSDRDPGRGKTASGQGGTDIGTLCGQYDRD